MDILEEMGIFSAEDILEMISPYFFSIIYLFVILFIVAKFKGRVKNTAVNRSQGAYGRSAASTGIKPAGKASSTNAAVRNVGGTEAVKNRDVTYGSKRLPQNGLSLTDDRSSDWLAKQLKEEASAMVRISDMFQLKQQHANKCDAEFIKRFHESSCDAHGVDDGVKK